MRKLYIQKAHMLFSGNPGTREFGLGKRHSAPNDFVNEFQSLKPCVNSSDSHSFESLFEPAEGRYTWIKADPTFQGLRQLLNEPEDRVFIGTIPPSLERVASRPTKVIDEVQIAKIRGSSLSENWFNCSLRLNSELVAIIGNKGSGKSALADVLGLLGNTPRHGSFSFLRSDRFRDPKFNKAKHFEASLTWGDRTRETSVALDHIPDAEAVEKIRYIPQNYLEEICNEIGLGKASRFYAELQEVIFSHVPTTERLGFNSLEALLERRGAEIDAAVDTLVAELSDLNRQIATCQGRLAPEYRRTVELQLVERRRELRAHDEAKPIEVKKPEIDPTVQQRSKEDSESLDSKQDELNELESEIREYNERLALLAKRGATAERLLDRLRNLQRQVDGFERDSAEDLRELAVSAAQVMSFTVDTSVLEAITQQVELERITIGTQLDPNEERSLVTRRLMVMRDMEALRGKLAAPQREYQSFLQRLRDWEAGRAKIVGSSEITGSEAHLESLLGELVGLPEGIARLSRRRDKKSLEIYREKQRLRSYYERYYGAVQKFLDKHPLTAGDGFRVTFDVALVQAGFSERFLSKINQRKTGSFSGVEEGASELKRLIDATEWSSPISVLRFSRKLVQKLNQHADRQLEIKDQLKQGESAQGIYDLIFAFEYLSPIYRLTWEGKGLEQLSPGERGNLLLIFYLLVDRDSIPLVIDQPEENLDNQTVVRTLVPCMKDAKKRRQIIMVTHNPNLAVVCDAEQIVYAEIDKGSNNAVTYISGSIEDPVINKKIVDVLEGTRPAFDKRESKYLPQ
jgi:ABC-type lipoprotein export system ATPase subunit